jgi:hypothetical protein
MHTKVLRRSDARVDAGGIAAPGLPTTLRGKARKLGVSHETVRQAMTAAGLPTGLEARNARIRAMAEQNVPWPAVAAAFGLSPSAVRRVCRDMPPRRAGPKPIGAREPIEPAGGREAEPDGDPPAGLFDQSRTHDPKVAAR